MREFGGFNFALRRTEKWLFRWSETAYESRCMPVFFTQGVAVLFSEAPDLSLLRQHLEGAGYQISRSSPESVWPEMQGACLELTTDFPDGRVCWVDVCDHPWPDELGTVGEPSRVTGAQAMDAYGPWAHPGALARALQASRAESLVEQVGPHQAFVRLRITPVFDRSTKAARPDSGMASDHARLELPFLLRAVASLETCPDAIAYFNPNAELLLALGPFCQILRESSEQETFPIEAVCNFRRYRVDDEWSLVDSVGLMQLGFPDHEFAWADASLSRNEQIQFVAGLLHYQADTGSVIRDGHTTSDRQNRMWRASQRECSCMIPPRRVLHWTLDGCRTEPALLAARDQDDASPASGDEFDALLAAAVSTVDGWLARRQAIRARAVAWLRSPAFRTVYYDDAHVPLAVKIVLEREMPRSKAKESWNQVQHLGQQTPELWAQYQQLAEHGEIWFAAPLMANPSFETEANLSVPCGVVVPLEQTGSSVVLAGVFARAAYSVYSGESDKNHCPCIARILAEDRYQLFHREMLPVEETGGASYRLLKILLRKSWMPPEDVAFVPLLAMPGATGAVVQIPWHLVAGIAPAPGSMEPGRFANYAQLDRLAEAKLKTGKRIGFRTIASLIVWAIFLGGLIYGIFDTLRAKAQKPKKPPAAMEQAQPAVQSKKLIPQE